MASELLAQQAHEAFRALLLALAYPGRPRALPAAGWEAALALLLEAVWRDAPGAVLVAAGADASGLIESAARGTETEPEAGVTVLRLAGPDAARSRVVLEGPGVREALRVELPLSAGELAARERACAAPPLGVDLVLLDERGVLLGVPRTTRVRVER
jgi:alpha-D-ribose 1-methylphosphonate 5-triphosphate synthase subunit PhnH